MAVYYLRQHHVAVSQSCGARNCSSRAIETAVRATNFRLRRTKSTRNILGPPGPAQIRAQLPLWIQPGELHWPRSRSTFRVLAAGRRCRRAAGSARARTCRQARLRPTGRQVDQAGGGFPQACGVSPACVSLPMPAGSMPTSAPADAAAYLALYASSKYASKACSMHLRQLGRRRRQHR